MRAATASSAGGPHRLGLKRQRRVVDGRYRDIRPERLRSHADVKCAMPGACWPAGSGGDLITGWHWRSVIRARKRQPLFDDIGDLVARCDQLENTAVDLPVAEPLRQVGVVAEV